MLKTFIATAGLIAVVATPGQANDQLAHSLGVEPGVYTTSELIRLRANASDDDAPRANSILRDRDQGRFSTRNVGTSSGHRQLAASLGLDPGAYTTAQLVQIRQAVDDQQNPQVRHIKANGGSHAMASLSTSDRRDTSGHRQMAASVGVDADAVSTAEVIRIRTDRWSD